MRKNKFINNFKCTVAPTAGADPGFPVGGHQPRCGGALMFDAGAFQRKSVADPGFPIRGHRCPTQALFGKEKNWVLLVGGVPSLDPPLKMYAKTKELGRVWGEGSALWIRQWTEQLCISRSCQCQPVSIKAQLGVKRTRATAIQESES